MCSSYSAFDCIFRNRLIAYYSFADLQHVKLVKMVISAYKRFSLFSLAFVIVAVCFFLFSNKRDMNFRVMAVRDVDLRTCLPKNIYLCHDFQSIQKLTYYKNCLCKCLFVQYRRSIILIAKVLKFQMYCGQGGSILGSVNLFKIFRGISEVWENHRLKNYTSLILINLL